MSEKTVPWESSNAVNHKIVPPGLAGSLTAPRGVGGGGVKKHRSWFLCYFFTLASIIPTGAKSRTTKLGVEISFLRDPIRVLPIFVTLYFS